MDRAGDGWAAMCHPRRLTELTLTVRLSLA